VKEGPASRIWQRHPLLGGLLRAAIVIVPIAGFLGAAILLSRALPRAQDGWTTLLWLAAIIAAAVVTLVLLDLGARRLLPLAALLRVTLLFPDNAPSRFAVARRSGRWRELQARLQEARESGDVDEATRLAMVVELVLAMSVHDRATRGHSERVRVFTELIAGELKLSPDARDRLRWAAILHDIGKLDVPASTLNKQGRLSGAEWATIHRHPDDGARMVAPLLAWLDVWGLAVEQHHERFDGTGYPRGLRAQRISLGARIVSVADSYEVMTAPRAYRRAVSPAAARTELARGAGSQFDPAVVRAFLNVSIGRLWRVIGIGALAAQVPVVGGLLAGARDWATPAIVAAAAVAVLALGGSTRIAPLVPPGQVAGIRAPHPAAQPAGPLPTVLPAVAPTASATASVTPAPPPTPAVVAPRYPIVFPMSPMPRR
jgi:putative nucleotidyltransferase with HDIG domain